MTLSSLTRRLPGGWNLLLPWKHWVHGLREFFAYHGVWALGVRLLRQWTIRQKILVVLSLTGLPLVPMSVLLLKEQARAVGTAERHIAGGALATAAYRLVEAIQDSERGPDAGKPAAQERLMSAVQALRTAKAGADRAGLKIWGAWESVDPAVARLELGATLSPQGRLDALATARDALLEMHSATVDEAGFLLTGDPIVQLNAQLAYDHVPRVNERLWSLFVSLRVHAAEQTRSGGNVHSVMPSALEVAGRIYSLESSLRRLLRGIERLPEDVAPEAARTGLLAAGQVLVRAREAMLTDGSLSLEEIGALRDLEVSALKEVAGLRDAHAAWLAVHDVAERNRAENWRVLMLLGISISIGLSLYLFYAFYLVMRGGLFILNEQMQSMARGDLSSRQRPRGGDEVADTMRAMSMSVERLADLLASVRHGSSSVSQAAQQIAIGNSDLRARNHRTNESLEKVVDGVARYSAQLEACSRQVETVVDTVQALRLQSARNRRQMEHLRETLNSVRGQSRQITDAVSLIDAVAFRTNILALNASVEASKAGETGRGFAVVAQEVRSLALRSAEAARRIGAIVGSSSNDIEQSSRLAEETGRAIVESDGHIDRIHGAMGDVASLTREGQLESSAILDQVKALRESTEKNLGLVEQLANASHSLRSHGERLTHRLSHFKLG